MSDLCLFPFLGALTKILNLTCSVYGGTNFCILPVWFLFSASIPWSYLLNYCLSVCWFSFCLSTETLFISCLSLLSLVTPKTDEKQILRSSVILKILGKHRWAAGRWNTLSSIPVQSIFFGAWEEDEDWIGEETHYLPLSSRWFWWWDIWKYLNLDFIRKAEEVRVGLGMTKAGLDSRRESKQLEIPSGLSCKTENMQQCVGCL